jgi:hypothetical protein
MENPKLYAFIANCHYHIITRIDEDKFGAVDFCTMRYSTERFSKLEDCLKWAVKKWKVYEFNTYRELFQFFLGEDRGYDIMDLFKVKDVIDRQTLIESDGYVDKCRSELFKDL